MNANDRFEILASLFHDQTGFLAPGKDVPATIASDEYMEQRAKAWAAWSPLESALHRIYLLEQELERSQP